MLGQILHFITNPANTYATHSSDYIRLCGVAVLVSIVIAIPLGVLVAQRPLPAFVAINTSGLARAIPTLAILSAAVPVLGIGFQPAVIALTIIGIPPILLNTIAGLRGIDLAAIDAARGMGMTAGQILRRIQIPLVLPIVAAGVRTSAVQIVATGTLAGIIGAGGWGEYIYLGLRNFDVPAILVGAASVALLALLAEVVLAYVERLLTPVGMRRGRQATAGPQLAGDAGQSDPAPVQVGV
ncbi:MAG: ABC transporter permease [Ktedonobacterales bacterium]